VQLVIALVVTRDGFPLAYEVMNGHTADCSTLRDFLGKIETAYGQARRVWVMDRGIPSEAMLQEMRDPERQTFYLVGTPKGRIQQQEKKWLDLPWQKVRDSVEVKLYRHEGELYVLAKSSGRQAQEIAMRRKRLARLLRKLRAMRKSLPKRDQLLLRIGAAKKEAGRAFGFVKIQLPERDKEVPRSTFTFHTDKAKLKAAEQRDGHYLLRSNLTGEDPAVLWTRYVQLTQIESVFRSLKSALGIRPIYHPLEPRADAHGLIAFRAYCLQVTLKNRLMLHAPGLTPVSVFEKLSTIQMVEVWIPLRDGRWLVLPRHTQPEADVQAWMEQIRITLPPQPPPRIKSSPLPAAATNQPVFSQQQSCSRFPDRGYDSKRREEPAVGDGQRWNRRCFPRRLMTIRSRSCTCDFATPAMFIVISSCRLPIIRPSSGPNPRAAFSALPSAITSVTSAWPNSAPPDYETTFLPEPRPIFGVKTFQTPLLILNDLTPADLPYCGVEV